MPAMKPQLDRLRQKWQSQGLLPASAIPEPQPETVRKPVWPAIPEMHWVESYRSEHLHGRAHVSAIASCDARPFEISAPLEKWAFLDTETTGIAGGTGTYAFLVGVGVWDGETGEFRIHQFFMRDFDQEPQMLAALAELLKPYEVLVTYNGKSFDAPLLETRYRMMRQRVPHESMDHLDLLHSARRIWKLRLQSCRLVELESSVLGYTRVGDIPGMLIPYRYFEYLKTGRMTGLQPVFHHNRLDILTLACLTSLVLGVLGDPVRASLSQALDLYGLAGWLERLGRADAALEVYRRALNGRLPADVAARARAEMAMIHKRAGEYHEAIPLWRALRTRDAAVELAKYYEHHARNYPAALEAALAANDDHRVNRLRNRIAVRDSQPRSSSAASPR
jgi:uncharacterized protein YprB with RNaseH-like and TPR domain